MTPARGQVYRCDVGFGLKPWLIVSNNARNRHTADVLAIGRHVDVSGDYAYVVAPVTFAYKLPDRQVNQTGSVFTACRFANSAQSGA